MATDGQGAIDVADLGRVLGEGSARPTIVCLQADIVSSGAFNDLPGGHRHRPRCRRLGARGRGLRAG
ncbi:MAG TPA: hypothetical protein VGV63_12420 [Acidimicrobiales bacterium]|nr:hypothetical protein [Acidimicrobiales bacterium]